MEKRRDVYEVAIERLRNGQISRVTPQMLFPGLSDEEIELERERIRRELQKLGLLP